MARCKGVAVVDIGGQSTRPGAEIVGEAEEIYRCIYTEVGLCTYCEIWR